ncbi:LamB/YcsF [Delitschia confertaspora ATCC 74209]|uniref:LamB/YcsF n=1 Tax=Delitschia confertaspora ATCC 74209 TaxID=1513339 RepID=A0A9P4JTI6_9PLEO|nr:LamB/YcsF [Delitschia confertaspora ATCC 74209]
MPVIKHPVKINVDLGEGYGNFKCGPDDELIPLIDHANVACGFHAGHVCFSVQYRYLANFVCRDPLIMQQTVRTCKEHNIAVGAHPGLPDIQGFGRREIKMSPEELTAAVRYQVGALKAFLDAEGMPLHHVKPHGILYGMMYRDKDTCRAVYSAVPVGTTVFGLAGTYHEEVAKEMGLPFVAEIYGDVKYNADATLVIDRKKKPWHPDETKRHVRSLVENASVIAVTGEEVQMQLGDYPVSLCCHSDSPGCVEITKTARQIVDEFNGKHFSEL